MIPGVNITSGKASTTSINKAGGRGWSEPFIRGFRGQSTLKKKLCSKEHLKGFKIDLNAARIMTVQDYKHTKNYCE